MSDIQFFFENVSPLKFNQQNLKWSVSGLVKKEFKNIGDISVIFCSDDYLLKMNEQYLNHYYYTDIITFDYVENSIISGDLFISIDRVKENAVKFDVSFVKELYRVVFHGVLHLTGYKDKTEKEKAIMREKENYYLDKVDFSAEEI